MRKLHVAGLALLAGGLTAGAVACSSSHDELAVGSVDGVGGVGGGGTHTTTGTTTGMGGAGGGSHEDPPEQPPEDAGPDAEFTCEGLDPDQPVVLYLSADDSNSMASPVHARERLNVGSLPGNIRTYEFLNYYNIAYPAPPTGQLSIFTQMENGVDTATFDLQLAVRSFDAVSPRRPMTITLVLDTSGSMSGASIDRERAVVLAVAESLAAGDVVNMVVWDTSNAVLLNGHTATGPNDPTVVATATALAAGGGTDLHGGLVAGYDLAELHYGESRLNRILLISDGGANVGVTDKDLIALHSEDADQEGIYMVGVGTGPADGYNDALMDTVTDKGRGAYVYVDSLEEARHMFVDRFDEVMEVAARGVQVELTLPWYFEMHKFYGEEYSENPDEVEPQHLAPSDAMIFNQVLRACDPNVVDGSDTIAVKASWHTPLSHQPMEIETSITVDQLLEGSTEQLTKGKAIVAYAEALKTNTAEDVQAANGAVLAANPEGTDLELNEIRSLLEKHPAFAQ